MANVIGEVTGLKLQNHPRQAVLRSNGDLDIIEYNESLVEVVKCTECGTVHLTPERSYLELVGNLNVGGGSGGLLGNGDWQNIGVPVYYFCINNQCLSDYIHRIEMLELTDAGQIPEIHHKSRFYTRVPLALGSNYHIKDYTVIDVLGINQDEVRVKTDVHIDGKGTRPREVSIQKRILQAWLYEGKIEVINYKEGK